MDSAPKDEPWLSWFVRFRDPRQIYDEQPTYLLLEYAVYLFSALILKHALRKGGRHVYMWFASVLYGMVVESLSYFLPEHIDNFWHGQSSIIFLGGRFPLHIVLFYPLFYYNAAVTVDKLQLKKWAEPFAVGVAVVLFDVPFDIMGIKLLWWTWHDTDPNIYDRAYWVPLTSYYFHASFATAFAAIFHGSHRYFTGGAGKWENKGFVVEILCMVLTGLFSMPVGVLLFIPNYHPLHDSLGLHTRYCDYILFAAFLGIIWKGWTSVQASGKRVLDELGIVAILHYTMYTLLVFLANPETQRSTGIHEKVGPCNETAPVYTAFGQVLSKRKYLCLQYFDEKYFDFACLSPERLPKEGATWYTVCGTPYPNNYTEYVIIVNLYVALGGAAYYYMHSRSERGKMKTK